MRKSSVVVLAVALLTVVIGSSLAYADDLVANIQFPFKAGGKDFPAGRYIIKTDSELDLTVRNLDTGAGAILLVSTRISARDDQKSLVILDKKGDEYYLSEVYMPGIDGFALQGAQGKHSHVKVNGGNH